MSIKYDVDVDLNEEEIASAFKSAVDTASGLAAEKAAEKAKELANSKLKSGLKFWEQGFLLEKAGDGAWVIAINGKMANLMEDGFGAGEISKLILGGNRYKYNKTKGKDYVDVPIDLSPDKSGNLQGTTVRVQQFQNIQELQKTFTFSDYKNKTVSRQDRLVKKIRSKADKMTQTIMQTKKSNSDSPAFITFRRLTPGSSWPQHPFSGAKVLDDLDDAIEQAFEAALQKLI